MADCSRLSITRKPSIRVEKDARRRAYVRQQRPLRVVGELGEFRR